MLPNQDRLVTNGLATVHDWAQEFVLVENWDQAVRTYWIGHEIRPDEDILQTDIRECIARKASEK